MRSRKRRKTTPMAPPSPAAAPPPVSARGGIVSARRPRAGPPRALNPEDCAAHLSCDASGLGLAYYGPGLEEKDAAAVRADKCVPPAGVAMFYFEVEVICAGATGRIGLGLCGREVCLKKMPGWQKVSYGYHGDDGCAFKETGQPGEKYGPKYGEGDVVGCCWDMVDNLVFFTRNGIALGTAFRSLEGDLYPTVGMQTKGGSVRVNFGDTPFVFDFAEVAAEQRDRVLGGVFGAEGVEGVEDVLLSYMIHAGYARTAKAFGERRAEGLWEGDGGDGGAKKSRQKEALLPAGRPGAAAAGSAGVVGKRGRDERPQSLENGKETNGTSSSHFCATDLSGIAERQHVMARVLAGDVRGAFKYAKEECAGLVVDDVETRFLLQSQTFIELLVGGKGGDGSGSAASPSRNPPCVDEALAFGREELLAFHVDFPVELEEVLSLLAYKDPASSPVAHLVQNDRRERVAERLNMAMLRAQGREEHSALERIVAQLQVVLDVHSESGQNGPAALVRGVEDI